MRLAIISLALALAACAHGPAADRVRFANQPVVWRVSDRVPLASQPEERDYNRSLYHTDGFVVRRATRAMDLPDPVRAADVNALDEVPDSTWFTNRIGVRDVSIAELRRGPNVDPSPFDHLPWKITGGKVGGTAVGFVFEDARGDKYLMKFDMADVPEMETGAHVIGHRIVWALGFNVPQDYLGYVRPDDIQVALDATKKDPLGNKSPITRDEVLATLEKVYRTDDGRIRVLASRYLPGVPIGPYAREGTRPDDPNDVIPHERRRSVRGQAAMFSWINHSDMQEDNTLDIFVKHPNKKTGHVVHYLIDFGKAFGVMGYVMSWKTQGYTYRLDVGWALRSLFTLGLWKRPWDDIRRPPLRGVGVFDAAHFDPSAWRANSQYWPWEDADRFDGYWGAKHVMRFTRAQLAAIVDEARYSDPRTSRYMLDTLIARQRKVGAYWFRQVSPLDAFSVETVAGVPRLCFTDLALHHGLEPGPGDHAIELAGARRTQPATARACTAVEMPAAGDGYTIVKLSARALPSVNVHLARDERGTPRVIGVWRE